MKRRERRPALSGEGAEVARGVGGNSGESDRVFPEPTAGRWEWGMGDLAGSRLVSGRNRVPGSIPSRDHTAGQGRVSSARARIEPGTRFRRRAPRRLIGDQRGRGEPERTERAGETIHHAQSALARCSGSPVSGAQGGGQPEPGVAPMPGYPPKSHERQAPPRLKQPEHRPKSNMRARASGVPEAPQTQHSVPTESAQTQ